MLGMISDVIIQAKETKVKNKYHLQKRKNPAGNLGNFTMRILGTKKPPFPKKERSNFGASSRTRTDDLRITNALLYQLSHTSSCFVKLYKDGGLSGTTMIF